MKPSKISKVQTASVYKQLVLIFTLAVVAIFILIIYFSLSKTTILITLTPQEKSTNFNVDIKPESTDEEDDSRIKKINGYAVSVKMKKTKTFTIESEGKEVPAQATGKVTIYNNWSKEQPLAATTRLLSPDGILFRIKDRIDVPAGGKIENVEVYADQEGQSGNIKPTTFTIPGLWQGLQDKIFAESSESMTGGIKKVSTISQSGVTKARHQMIDELTPEGKAILEQSEDILDASDSIPSQAVLPEVLGVIVSPEIGEASDSFELTLTIRFIGAVFDEDDLLNFSLEKIKSELSKDEEVHSYQKESGLNYEIKGYNLEEKSVTLKTTFQAEVVPQISSTIFKPENLVGMSEEEINAYYTNYKSVANVEVKFSPFWVSRVPKLKDHIEIEIINEQVDK